MRTCDNDIPVHSPYDVFISNTVIILIFPLLLSFFKVVFVFFLFFTVCISFITMVNSVGVVCRFVWKGDKPISYARKCKRARTTKQKKIKEMSLWVPFVWCLTFDEVCYVCLEWNQLVCKCIGMGWLKLEESVIGFEIATTSIAVETRILNDWSINCIELILMIFVVCQSTYLSIHDGVSWSKLIMSNESVLTLFWV